MVPQTYLSALSEAMCLLAREPNVVFLGQGVAYPGTTITETFKDVPREKLLELPVAEEMQTGMATGMALDGLLPVCVFPRWNFVLCAANQIINHLDRISLYSPFKPKVIIRIASPSNFPFNPGPQHDDDFTEAFRLMLRTIQVVTLGSVEDIIPAYRDALLRPQSTILVEYTKFYQSTATSPIPQK